MSSREKGAEASDGAAGNAGEEARHHRLNHVLREILEAEERGECPDREALIRRYPEFHSEIAEFLELQAPLPSRAGRTACPVSSEATSSSSCWGREGWGSSTRRARRTRAG